MLKSLTGTLLLVCFHFLLAGQNGTIKGTVSDQFGFLPGAKIELVGTDIVTTCKVDGNFKLDVIPGDYIVKASYLMYSSQQLASTVSFNNLNPELNFTLKLGSSVDQNFEVGSRSQPKSQLETVVAVDIITQKQILESNQSTLSQVLQYLVPSFHSTQQTISDGTDHIDPISLRGLGPDQLLILINGKRTHSSSLINVNGTLARGSVGTDLNVIPLGIIDRIEILKDGAAAQYGSDAIAGVINIVLKEQAGIFTGNFSTQPTIQNDGTETSVGGNYGIGLKNGGFVNVTAEFRSKGAINRSGDYTGNVYSLNDSIDQLLIEERDFFSKVEYKDRRVMQIGSAKTEDAAIFFNAKIPFNLNAELYTNGGINTRIGEARGFYRFPVSEESVVEEIFPDGFSPEIRSDISDNEIVVGVRGRKNGWLLDLSNLRGSNNFGFTVNNSNNASLGVSSPTNFFAGGFEYEQVITNLDFSKSLDSLEIIDKINLAFGFAYRQENYQIFQGELASYQNGQDTTSTGQDKESGVQLFPGFQPQNALNKSRNNTSAYLDLEFYISKKILFSAATRYETFSDFGRNISWKIGGLYRLTKSISLRSSYSTGFRAPSLHQIYFNNIGTQFIDGQAFKVGTFNNESSVAKAFGIDALKPETSVNVSGGITAKISKNFSFSLDAYHIDIDDRIVLSGRFDDGVESVLTPQGVAAAQFFTNAVNTNTKGLDITFQHNQKLGGGRLITSLAYNFNQLRVGDDIRTSSSLLNGDEETLFNREEISRLEASQPRSKAIFRFSYEYKKWTFLIRNTWFGTAEYIHPSDGDPTNWVLNELTGEIESRDQIFGAKMLTDFTVSFRLTKNVNWTVGGTNIFNIYPDKHKHSANISHGRFVYSRRVQQFGVRGASYLTKLSVVF